MIFQRRIRITELVQQSRAVRVSELAKRFQVSEVTIRNDLMQLEKQGQLVRDRGGALPLDHSREVTTLLAEEQRSHMNITEKRQIARAAAALVSPGDKILIDAGTTAVEMVPYLAAIRPLTIVTNALNVAREAGAKTEAEIILLGGSFNRESSSVLGTIAEQILDEFVIQKAFLGVQAVDLRNGFTDTTLEIAHIKRAMIKAARRVIVLADSTKFSHSGFIKVAPLTVAQTIITDAGLPLDARTELEALNIEVLTV
ncbi:MAG: DeoR/GlpR family DNA-binding transcription regulator [Porticoccaceae bacterium]|nr:DeoR/GlpR family DNA-binding transcription regulator [Porticoccaceae bacterium]